MDNKYYIVTLKRTYYLQKQLVPACFAQISSEYTKPFTLWSVAAKRNNLAVFLCLCSILRMAALSMSSRAKGMKHAEKLRNQNLYTTP